MQTIIMNEFLIKEFPDLSFKEIDIKKLEEPCHIEFTDEDKAGII